MPNSIFLWKNILLQVFHKADMAVFGHFGEKKTVFRPLPAVVLLGAPHITLTVQIVTPFHVFTFYCDNWPVVSIIF
jgi:hypothetical protein